MVTQTVTAARGGIKTTVPTATAAVAEVLAQLPGGLIPVPSPGHTSGHTAYFMASEKVLFSSDALVTGHPLLDDDGPQLLPSLFNHDEALSRLSARQLAAQPAHILVPGHGAPIVHNESTP
ncbi:MULTISPECIES: MBL fold metallo-hydrolase [Mycobacterium]|uniref:MBL fold metallo-hydrolase n=1 Tax=Mycobacterium TaxID=1763 RepID=UPI000EA97A47|nr:MBL fold metallo-hydrolase [Mycobacterium sp. CnD-18-1]